MSNIIIISGPFQLLVPDREYLVDNQVRTKIYYRSGTLLCFSDRFGHLYKPSAPKRSLTAIHARTPAATTRQTLTWISATCFNPRVRATRDKAGHSISTRRFRFNPRGCATRDNLTTHISKLKQWFQPTRVHDARPKPRPLSSVAIRFNPRACATRDCESPN